MTKDAPGGRDARCRCGAAMQFGLLLDAGAPNHDIVAKGRTPAPQTSLPGPVGVS